MPRRADNLCATTGQLAPPVKPPESALGNREVGGAILTECDQPKFS